MKVEFIRDLPIKAEPIDNHYGFPRVDKLDVSNIEMGQSSTSIELLGYSGKRFNSIHFKFYLYNKEIDIYIAVVYLIHIGGRVYRWLNTYSTKVSFYRIILNNINIKQ